MATTEGQEQAWQTLKHTDIVSYQCRAVHVTRYAAKL
jgi:hypothetical protein